MLLAVSGFSHASVLQPQKIQRSPKPNPLSLFVKVDKNRNVELNNEAAGTLDDWTILTTRLHDIFAQRVEYRAYAIGMESRTELTEWERIEKSVYFNSSQSLPKDEVARLMSAIEQTGAKPIIVLTDDDYINRFGWLKVPRLLPGATPITGTLRGGILQATGTLNGHAASLPEPVYAEITTPKLASKVRVRVMIDKSGQVYRATVISGHPLLRAAALDAARKATFAPTFYRGEPVNVTGIILYTFGG
jgi:TonB family protein